MNQKQFHEWAETYHQFGADKPGIERATLEGILSKLHRYETTLHRLFETYCNRELTPQETQKIAKTEDRVNLIAKQLGFKVKFNQDPRGGAIRLVLPSNKSNNWDG